MTVVDTGVPKIDVACAAQVHAAEVKITNRQTRVCKQLPLDAETSLLDVRLRVVFCKQVKTWIDATGSRWRAENIRIDRTWIRNQRAVQTHAGDLYAVLRMRRAEHDRRCASEENSVTATQHSLFVKRIAETKTWSKVVAVTNRRGRIQADRPPMQHSDCSLSGRQDPGGRNVNRDSK